MNVKVAHVEAGIRSGDWSMPEEINRMVTDSITNYFFTTSEFANESLRKCGISENRIFFVGNTMIDTLLANMERFKAPDLWGELNLKKGEYLVLTLHRPSNVDSCDGLKSLLDTIAIGARDYPIVFPVHPRTKKVMESIPSISEIFKLVEPQPYLEFNYLVKNAKAVITDSGGITEEATVFGVPCMTLRDSTERPETITIGTNELIGTSPENLLPALEKLFSGEWKRGSVPPLWDGKTADRIVGVLGSIFC
jgi:UDP-N-acetylglucosamine 2-epimerase (non-hydrolysing)